MRKNDEELTELLEAVDIEVYLDSNGVTYRHTMGSSGPQLNIKECPVCGNSNWKVYLNRESGIGNCFAGDHPPGKNFNKFSFIRGHLGEGVPAKAVIEHIKRFAQDFGWRKRRVTSVETVVDRGSPVMPAHHKLPHKGRNLSYLENRGIDGSLSKYFNLGISINGYFKYQLDGGWRFQHYLNRVMIPVFDLDGKLVSFQGRDITGTQDPKYLFPPGFSATGEHLFNGHNFIDAEEVIIGEGAFDVFALKAALDHDQQLRNIVPIGTFGKHLSHGGPSSQLEKFKTLIQRGLKRVTIMWDGEVQATDDAVVAGHLLRSLGLSVRIAMLPALKDPNEVLGSVVRAAYYAAIPLTLLSGVSIALKRRDMNKQAEQANSRLT